MSKMALMVLLVTAFSGCAMMNDDYGNFTQNFPAVDIKIADDTVRQLSTLYSPASTRLKIEQEASDPFGVALIAGLREKGYAVAEFVSENDWRVMSADETSPALKSDDGLRLRYVLDYVGGNDLYRINIMIGDSSLARAYLLQNDTALAAGAWVRKE